MIHYSITFYDYDGKTINPYGNETTYTVEDERKFILPPTDPGYHSDWTIGGVLHSTGDLETYALIGPIVYDIRYECDEGYNPNEVDHYMVTTPTIVFAPPVRDYYIGTWSIPSIPQGSTENVIVTAIWTPIQYNITYDLGNHTDVVNPNPTTINVEQTVELRYITKSGYMNAGWKRGDNYVYTLSGIHEDITLTAMWSDGYEFSVPKDMSKLVVTLSGVSLVLPSQNFNNGLVIEVKSYITRLNIKSTHNIRYKMNIHLPSRYSDMDLYLQDVKMISPNASTPTIYMPSQMLNLYSYGTCEILGANGKNNPTEGGSGGLGGVAIKCRSVCFYSYGSSSATVCGGNGGNGFTYGGNGGYAVDAYGTIYASGNNLKLIGGNGGSVTVNAPTYGLGVNATSIGVTNDGNYNIVVSKGSNGTNRVLVG